MRFLSFNAKSSASMAALASSFVIFLGTSFNGVDEVVYASPAEGGAQTALATVARRLGKRATIFVARRAEPHPRTVEAAKLGAQIISVAPGYLSVVQARAREYCDRTGARLMPFGADMVSLPSPGGL